MSLIDRYVLYVDQDREHVGLAVACALETNGIIARWSLLVLNDDGSLDDVYAVGPDVRILGAAEARRLLKSHRRRKAVR